MQKLTPLQLIGELFETLSQTLCDEGHPPKEIHEDFTDLWRKFVRTKHFRKMDEEARDRMTNSILKLQLIFESLGCEPVSVEEEIGIFELGKVAA